MMNRKLNNKGFTFMEILVTIALIGLIVAIAIPSIMSINKKINLRLYETKKGLILSSAEMYAQDEKLPTGTIITVSTLLQNNYIKADETDTSRCPSSSYPKGCMINPVDKTVLNSVSITLTLNVTTYTALATTGWPEE